MIKLENLLNQDQAQLATIQLRRKLRKKRRNKKPSLKVVKKRRTKNQMMKKVLLLLTMTISIRMSTAEMVALGSLNSMLHGVNTAKNSLQNGQKQVLFYKEKLRQLNQTLQREKETFQTELKSMVNSILRFLFI